MRHWLEHWLHAVWYEGAASGLVLLPLSWLYRSILALRMFTYRAGWRSRYRASVPVIVVGNITAGGVGKTPFVVWLVERLQQLGYKPGVVTRGYGGTISDSTVVTSLHSARETGDEALMLSRRLSVPVIAGKRRAHSVAMLEDCDVDIIVADDGLQHYALHRDIEICVVDERRQFGNRRLLPAGPLREPVSRLATVDITVPHRQNLEHNGAGMTLGNPRLRHLKNGSITSLSSLEGETVHAVAGVGHPERFFDSLRRAGINVLAHPFADHHDYAAADLEFGDDRPVLMTDKDAVKCERFAQEHFYSVSVDALVSSDIEETILTKLEQLNASKSA